ncbi:MAG: endonuclease domain-containing protein [Candidatus Taylorbacteria bacterium]|nr:endonuclease domain-containing protein [Candidatus Taylorbacteria bacterium]
MRTVHNLTEIVAKRRSLRNNLTPQEIMLWARLKGKALGVKFRRQHSIGRYIVDFCCPSAQLIIELDGFQHGEESAERYDQERTNYLQSLGFKVLRFWNNEINASLDSVLGKILEEVNHTTPNPSSSEEGKKRGI